MMREARLPRARAGPAADDRRRRCAVVRRAEGRERDQRPARLERPRDRVDARHLQRLFVRERRQDPRQPPREHRLARAGRSREQEVVTTRGGELERAPGALLAADVGEVGPGRYARDSVPAHVWLELELAAQVCGRLGEVGHGNRLDIRERGLRGRLGRAEDARDALATRALGDGERAGNRPDPPV